MSILLANTSVTHTYGNVACVAIEYIKKFFPKDYFKTTHMSTKIAYKQLDIFRTNKEFFKREKPMLILRPRIELNDSSNFLYGTAMTQRMFNTFSSVEFSNTTPLVVDEDKGVMIRYMVNRLKIVFDVVIIVGTYNQQINIAHSLNNMLVPYKPFLIRSPLEAHIPQSVITPMCEHLDIPLDNTGDILQFMNTTSRLPITYKLKNSSGNKEFFCLSDNNIEAIVSDITLDDGNKKGMLYDTYSISFALSCEFFGISSYQLFTKDGSSEYTVCGVDDMNDNSRIQPLYTIPLLFNLNLPEGWQILNSPNYFVDNGDIDVTDLKSIFSSSVQQIIDHHLSMNIPLDTILQFRVFKGIDELKHGEGFKIDLTEMKLYTMVLDPSLTYRLFIIVNNALVHNMSSEIVGFNKEK